MAVSAFDGSLPKWLDGKEIFTAQAPESALGRNIV
jgi:hypothetical protein